MVSTSSPSLLADDDLLGKFGRRVASCEAIEVPLWAARIDLTISTSGHPQHLFRMTRVFGIDFSPLTEPWDKKLQTLGVVIVYVMVLPMIIVSSLLPFILVFTAQWYILLLYLVWFLYDRKSPQNGGYKSFSLKGWKYNQWLADYFPATVHKTVDLPYDRNYIFACHPHGVMCFGLYAAFMRESSPNSSRKFPGLRFVACTLGLNFYLMIRREWLLLSGLIDCSKESIQNALTWKSTGQAVAIAVGGAEEALYARPGVHKLKLLTRKGFVKLALRCGASLVPVYTFGENDIYRQVDTPEGSLVHKFQMWCKRHLGVSMPVFYGRGLLQLNFGFLPHRVPIDAVVGEPIDVPKIIEPSDEEVDRYHRQYCEALKELFEQHKTRFGASEDTKLILV